MKEKKRGGYKSTIGCSVKAENSLDIKLDAARRRMFSVSSKMPSISFSCFPALRFQQHLDLRLASDSVSQSNRVDPGDPLPGPPTISSSICGILTVFAMYKNASST